MSPTHKNLGYSVRGRLYKRVVVRAKSHRPEKLKEEIVLGKIIFPEKVCWRAKKQNRTTKCGRIHPPTHPPTQTHTHSHTCTHMHTHAHTCTHTHKHTHTHTHKHTHTHTHTHTAIDKVGRVDSICWCKEQSYVYCQSRKTGYVTLAHTHDACTPACTPARTHAWTRSHDVYVYM